MTTPPPDGIVEDDECFHIGGLTMENLHDIALQECPLCRGTGALEEEGGWLVYVQCLDCGCRTVELAYRSAEERREMAEKVALSWNLGKVIYTGPGD